jgi:hypothetical protein
LEITVIMLFGTIRNWTLATESPNILPGTQTTYIDETVY